MAALKFIDDIAFDLDMHGISRPTVTLFIDLSKASDTINHNSSFNKIYIYGILGV